MDSYADVPVSIAEARSDRTAKSNDWTPRDALISMLRQIDRKEIAPDQLVIIRVAKNGNLFSQDSSYAGDFSTYELMGLLIAESHKLHDGERG